jgi:hypothetical protein
MDARMVDATLKFHIAELRERLDKAAGIARAAAPPAATPTAPPCSASWISGPVR